MTKLVCGMWKILQLKKPRDFIISTNTSHSVREFIEQTFKLINITIKWRGKGVNEVGLDQNNIPYRMNITHVGDICSGIESAVYNNKCKNETNWSYAFCH